MDIRENEMGKFFALAGALFVLAGCAALDSAVGLNPDGSVDPSGGPLGTGANLLGSFIPWAGAALGAAGTLYSQIRRKKYANALKSVIGGVSAVRRLRSDAGQINITDEKFIEILKGIQESAKTDKLIKRVIAKEKETK
jgi:hypothetical protein